MPYLLALKAHWRLAVAGLLVIALLGQTLRLEMAQRRADKWEAHSAKLSATLDRLAEETKRQQAQTRARIEQMKRDGQAADKVATRIENAPLPGGCKTPPQILELDI